MPPLFFVNIGIYVLSKNFTVNFIDESSTSSSAWCVGLLIFPVKIVMFVSRKFTPSLQGRESIFLSA